METVYLDPATYHCSRTYADGAIAYETDFFAGKCDTFVEGYYAIPAEHSLQLADGRTLRGEMIAPIMDYRALDIAQRAYEQQLLADYRAALTTLGVTV